MKNLNETIWNEFYIGGDNGLFKITSTSSGIDKNKLVLSDDGKIPYITRTDINNGINHFIGDKQKANYKIDKGNVITIGLDTQTVFYQEKDFFTGQNIQVIKHKELNKLNSLFLITLLKVQMQKFNWGGNGATLGRLSRTKIMLPIDDKEKPDYEYMEQYAKSTIDKKTAKYITYANSVLDSIETKVIETLKEKEWKEFQIEDIGIIYSGKDIYETERMVGKIPYISSTAKNNGIGYLVGNNNLTLEENCLSVNRNGSVGYSFYHPYKGLFSNDCRKIKLNYTSKFLGFFIANQITMQKEKYNYGYKMGTERLKRQKIMLPINENGKPDYEYMEQYAKNLMHKKIKQYLDYLQK